MTYQELLRTYSRDVASGHADTDLSPRERRLVHVMLNLASNAGEAATDSYPPSDDTRQRTARYLGEIIWTARPLVEACSPASAEPFSNAHARAVEILRNV